MTMLREGDEVGQALAPGKDRYRSDEEIKIRDAVEPWLRERVPGCRIIHELNVGQGQARADIVAVGTDTFHSVEIKSSYDGTSRLMLQAGFFSLCSPFLWIVAATEHLGDVDMISYLLPHVGVIEAKRFRKLPDGSDHQINGYYAGRDFTI